MTLSAIELFGCAGGMAEGFRRAGVRFSWVFDYDPNACESYAVNLGQAPIRMDVHDLLRLVRDGWRPPGERPNERGLDLLVADPPCTPWSRAGSREGLEDERDMLLETIELIELLRPRAYLIGNVPGLDDAPNWGTVQRALRPLAAAGYCVADFVSLNAADYGVPQHRRRPFWFGHLTGPCIRWPEPTHCDPRELATLTLPGIDPLKPWVTCRDALAHLPPAELGQPIKLRWRRGTPHRASIPDEPAKTQTANTHTDGALLVNERHPICEPDKPARTVTARDRGGQSSSVLAIDRAHATFADEPSKTITARQNRPEQYMADSREWPWNRPATTVTADSRIPPTGHHGAGSYMSDGIKLSERARALLQGFPDGWVFAGATKKARSAQIGMAMPPGLAEPVARAVVEQLRGS